MKLRKLLVLCTLLIFAVIISACSNGEENVDKNGTDRGNENETEGNADTNTGEADLDPSSIEGDLTVIINRTDIVDTVFQDYAAEFQETYPNVNVEFEALTDYGGEIMPRMNTEEYGDVLLIPTEIPIENIPDYFEPLGDLAEMGQEYRGVEERAVDGKVYGIPIAITYTGIIYNKAVFAEAGIDELPTTSEDFIDALQKVKDNTDAIPMYTNYAAGWPLTQWEGAVTTVAGDVNYANQTMLTEEGPFDKDKPHYDLYKVMYDVAEKGLIEKDPLTTDWEASKIMMNNGEIATMVLGSWAIEQIEEAGENAEDIGYMPFPTNAEKVIFPLGADFNIAVNKNSKNKDAALAWLYYFTNESGYAVEQSGGINAAFDIPLPEDLAEFEEQGIEFLLLEPAKEGEEGLLDEIDKESEVGLWLEDKKKILIEAAIGNRDMSFDEVMDSWNEAWNAASDKILNE